MSQETGKMPQEKHKCPKKTEKISVKTLENAIKHNCCTQQEPLSIRIDINESGITVCNPLQLRSLVASHRTGLKNLSKKYAHYGQHIEIQKSETTFRVHLPFITH